MREDRRCIQLNVFISACYLNLTMYTAYTHTYTQTYYTGNFKAY